MHEPTIIAMLRLKNEERWIRKTLDVLSEICSGIVILDESTDNTPKICESFSKVIEIHRQSLSFDEVRDKNTLLKIALKHNPDYIFVIDGDEIISPNSKKIFLEELTVIYPEADIFEFQSLYIWDEPNKYRYDGIYSNIWQRRLIRMKNQPKDLLYDGTPFPGNAHCTPIPQRSVGYSSSVRSRAKILHYGYYDEELRQNKHKFHLSLDPNNTVFDAYKHTISGEGKHSGHRGIEFKTIPEGMYIPDIK
ncbi:MAG: glycosyltransferase [Nitrosopumilaceae archaeon]